MITFDTGALLAIERRRDRMLRVVRAAEQTAMPIVIPSVVVAEWWRSEPKGRMALFLRGVVVEPVGKELAAAAGAALAAIPSATTIDAIVMACAARRGGVVYTSDTEDLLLLQSYFRGVRVLTV